LPPALARISLISFYCLLITRGRACTVSNYGPIANPPSSNSPLASTQANDSATDDSLIRPGTSIGQLKLADTRDRVLQIFPFKSDVDEESDTETCGSEYLWVDSENEARGNVFIRLRESRVFQIEAASTRFHTSEGVKPLDSPAKVQKFYRGLRAYVMLHNTPMALGGGTRVARSVRTERVPIRPTGMSSSLIP